MEPHPHPTLSREREREPFILAAGRLWDEAKGMDWLDRAAATLPIRVAGPTNGPHGTAHFKHLIELGTLTPTQMATEYRNAEIFASMSIYEPFGLAVLEAAQAGATLVLRENPTFRELWDGAAHFVQAEQDLVPTLRHALENPIDARPRAAHYTLDALVEGTLAVHSA